MLPPSAQKSINVNMSICLKYKNLEMTHLLHLCRHWVAKHYTESCFYTIVTTLNQLFSKCRGKQTSFIDCSSVQSYSNETVIYFTSTWVNKMILFLKQASQQSLWKSSLQWSQGYFSLPVFHRVKLDSIQSETMPIRCLNRHLIATLKRLMGH